MKRNGNGGVTVMAPVEAGAKEILSRQALEFVADLHRRFNAERERLLNARARRQTELDGGVRPGFLEETRAVREGDWRVAPVPSDLQDRRVEITGPVERKMMINALNSGAKVFMADFEDSHTPSWDNNIQGQANLVDAVTGTISFKHPKTGKQYKLGDEVATLVVRPRGWHLAEDHVRVDGQPVSASLFDFGLYVFHNAKRLIDNGSGPYFYLPKIESHLEARLWDQVFTHTENTLGLEPGTIKATVLIETIMAAFEMEEILFELKDHAAGLNAGRWDYIFSMIKKFRNDPAFVLPDREQVTMTVPFMRAYTELLVSTCHKRGAHAMGGMAAFIPNRKDPEVTKEALTKVRQDKVREAGDGCDGTWVAHPDLVPVAMEVFDNVLGDKPNQLDRRRDDVDVSADDLLDTTIDGGTVTRAGIRGNVDVGIQYIASWLRGNGAAAINNLMEDAATAEIARSQIWQWVHQPTKLDDGTPVDKTLVTQEIGAAMDRIAKALGKDAVKKGRYDEARQLFERVALDDAFEEFLTIPAYQRIKTIAKETTSA